MNQIKHFGFAKLKLIKTMYTVNLISFLSYFIYFSLIMKFIVIIIIPRTDPCFFLSYCVVANELYKNYLLIISH